jgi:hypothetical protein
MALRTLGTSGEEIKEPTKWNKAFHWELGSERDSGVFRELGDLREFREVFTDNCILRILGCNFGSRLLNSNHPSNFL